MQESRLKLNKIDEWLTVNYFLLILKIVIDQLILHEFHLTTELMVRGIKLSDCLLILCMGIAFICHRKIQDVRKMVKTENLL